MSELAILVPVLGRAHQIEPLYKSLADATKTSYHIYFITSPGDTEVRDQIRETAMYSAIVTEIEVAWEPGRADFAKKINAAFAVTEEPWLFQAATDLVFTPGWDVEALRVAEETGAGVIGTNDLGNKLVMKGGHSTHTLFRRSYIEEFGGTFDGSGQVFSELYDHQWCDNETVQTAMVRGKFAFAKNSIVEHLHPHWGKAVMDSTYEKAARETREDRVLYLHRMRLLKGRGGRRATTNERRQERLNRRNLLREQAREAISLSICIASHGEQRWHDLAMERAYPSALHLGAHQVLIDHQSDANRAEVRNALAERATGEWLCFLDADDSLDSRYLSAMAAAAKPRSLLVPAVAYVIGRRQQRAKFWPERDIKTGNWMVVGTLVERSLFMEVGGWKHLDSTPMPNEYDDWHLWMRCLKAGATPVKVPSAVYVAHVQASSAHRTASREQRLAWHAEVLADVWPEGVT